MQFDLPIRRTYTAFVPAAVVDAYLGRVTPETRVTPPEPVVSSHLYHPLRLPDGRRLFQVETGRRYSSNDQPLIRDATGAPLVLREEPGIGSIVQVALSKDGTMRAVKLTVPVWADPFD
jgi:hypothetical protein